MDDVVRPWSPTETIVAEVWRELLQLDEVAVTDDFFAVGGHSMLAVQVLYQLSRRTGVELDLEAFFDLATVEEVAAEIDKRASTDRVADVGMAEGEL
jgi:acyl carrier protein